MLFLLRFMATKAAASSPFFILKPMDLRLCSPVSGGSTLVLDLTQVMAGPFCSHVRENLAAERTGHHLREVQNLQLLKWQHRDSNPPSSGGLRVRPRISTAPSWAPSSGSRRVRLLPGYC